MLKFWYNVAMLSIESQRVVQLRAIKLAMGGRKAQAEAQRMVTEKISASLGAAAALLNGGSSNLIVAQYRSRVRSNSRRLSREYIE
jgi:hypothetical protein